MGDRISPRLTDWLKTVLDPESNRRFPDARTAKAELLKIITDTPQIKLEKQDVELMARTYETEVEQPEIAMNWESGGEIVVDQEYDCTIESRNMFNIALWTLVGAFPTIGLNVMSYMLSRKTIEYLKANITTFSDHDNLSANFNSLLGLVQWAILFI